MREHDPRERQRESSPQTPPSRCAPAGGLLALQRAAGNAAARRVARRAAGERWLQRVVYTDVVRAYSPGDLLYGLAGPRHDTWSRVKNKMALWRYWEEANARGDAATMKQALDAMGLLEDHDYLDPTLETALVSKWDEAYTATIDELNNQFLGTTGGGRYGEARAHYLEDPTYGSAGRGKIAAQAKEFKAWLETRVDPSSKRRGVQFSAPERVMDRIKKACKVGLDWAAKNDHRVFFIIDGVNMSDVVGKRKYNVADDKKSVQKYEPAFGDANRDITPAELRSLYRRWGDPKMAAQISFWKGGAKVRPPWEEEPFLWAAYGQAMADKKARVAEDDKKRQALEEQARKLEETANLEAEVARRTKESGWKLHDGVADLLARGQKHNLLTALDVRQIQHFLAFAGSDGASVKEQERLFDVSGKEALEARRLAVLVRVRDAVRATKRTKTMVTDFRALLDSAKDWRKAYGTDSRSAVAACGIDVDALWPAAAKKK
ncbi:MAG TPA: hypothetical protein VD931_01700 [Baekduia sp.]|nr:hypothetical protein [Baekduia sp.]